MMHITDPKLFKIFANPFFWRWKAKELRHAADLLKAESEIQLEKLHDDLEKKTYDSDNMPPFVGSSCFAMYGFSLECLLKGVIIWKHPEYVSDGKISRRLKTHDLIILSKIAEFEISSSEKLMFENTNKWVTEFRYPVPNSMEETNYNTTTSGDYFQQFDDLYSRLNNLIKGFNIYGHDEDRCPKCIARKKEEKALKN